MEATLTLRQEKTVDDYMRLDEGTPVQLIRGEFIMSPSPRSSHQRASFRLSGLLYNVVFPENIGEVFTAPIDVFVGSEDVYQPDIVFVTREHLHYIEEDGIHGPPDLVIEILSKRTAGFDLLLKKDSYEAFGVREYWIVDPMQKTIECFLNSAKGYESTFVGSSGKVCSTVLPAFCVDVARLFAK
jgi:Uma2 family endonuclease